MYELNEFVTVVNRSSKPIKGTWNGRHFDVKPGKTAFPLVVAQAIKRQNPIMGSQGYELFDVQYLVGIEELGDDISPIEQSTTKELMDPVLLHGDKKMTEVKGVTGLYGRGSVAPPVTGGGMVETTFEKP